MHVLQGFDFDSFWERSDYASCDYVDQPLTKELLAQVEKELGVKLPASYVRLAEHQNGGTPRFTCHKMSERTTWAEDHIAITGIYSVGRDKLNSLCGGFGSKFWKNEWGYPDIGVYFADCPSAGHDMLCLDYRACGAAGEPTVVHVDQEWDYKITRVAPSFEEFIRGLQADAPNAA